MADALIPLFAGLHTLGAVIGVGTITFAELFYTKAAGDGVIDHHERKYLHRMFKGIRLGMSVVLVSGIALIVLEYLVPDAPQEVLTAPFWSVQLLTVLILGFGLLLERKLATWWFASAAVLTAWWFILLIDIGYLNTAGFVFILSLYVVTSFIVAALMGYLRILFRK